MPKEMREEISAVKGVNHRSIEEAIEEKGWRAAKWRERRLKRNVEGLSMFLADEKAKLKRTVAMATALLSA